MSDTDREEIATLFKELHEEFDWITLEHGIKLSREREIIERLEKLVSELAEESRKPGVGRP